MRARPSLPRASAKNGRWAPGRTRAAERKHAPGGCAAWCRRERTTSRSRSSFVSRPSCARSDAARLGMRAARTSHEATNGDTTHERAQRVDEWENRDRSHFGTFSIFGTHLVGRFRGVPPLRVRPARLERGTQDRAPRERRRSARLRSSRGTMSELLRRWLREDVGVDHRVESFEEVRVPSPFPLPRHFSSREGSERIADPPGGAGLVTNPRPSTRDVP